MNLSNRTYVRNDVPRSCTEAEHAPELAVSGLYYVNTSRNLFSLIAARFVQHNLDRTFLIGQVVTVNLFKLEYCKHIISKIVITGTVYTQINALRYIKLQL